MTTKIEWTDETVNLAVGCARVSPGCERCYAERFVHRQMQPAHVGLTVVGKGEKGPRWNGKVRFLPDRLSVFQTMRKPRRIFINSLSDTFHPSISHEQRAAMFGAFLLAPQHTYQVLTKRPEEALAFEEWLTKNATGPGAMGLSTFLITAYYNALARKMSIAEYVRARAIADGPDERKWWLGVTAEDQQRANERIPQLLDLRWLPTKYFVSYEPALGPVDFGPWIGLTCTHEDAYTESDTNAVICRRCDDARHLDWIIVGGESGAGARPFDLAWARNTVKQCKAAGVACFVKQFGRSPIESADESVIGQALPGTYAGGRLHFKHSKGSDMSEWPEALRVREFPT